MAFDRNALEQQALRFVGRNQLDRALECYVTILKHDPRDVRARQKLAELLLKQGRRADAFRQLTEVARLHDAGGNHRAALAVYKQLVRLKPGDAELQGALADAYFNSGYKTEAVPHYETAFEELSRTDPDKAIHYGRQLLSIRHEDVSLRLHMARMLLAGGDAAGAAALYREAIEEYRRRGAMEDLARTARLAMAASPDDPELLVDAAEACVATGETPQALDYLKQAYTKDAANPRVLRMLAEILRDGPSPERARPVWMQLARVMEEAGRPEGEVEALEQAAALGRPDPALDAALAAARSRLEQVQFRLNLLPSAEPATDEELRVCTRAEVFLRYGRPERATPELAAALTRAPDAPSLLAWAAEIAAARGLDQEALGFARALEGQVSADERARVRLRREVLGDTLEPEVPAPAPIAARVEDGPVEDELIDDELIDDELIDDELVEDGLVEDELIDDEPVDDAPTEPPEAPPRAAGDPRGADPFGDPEPFGGPDPFGGAEAEGEGLFADVFRGEAAAPPAPPAPPAGGLEEARGLLGLGMAAEALALLRGVEGLEAALLRARALRDLGDQGGALVELKGLLLDAPDDAPELPAALFEFADLAAREGRRRAALRALEELAEDHPGHRAAEVGARLKALRRVLGRP